MIIAGRRKSADHIFDINRLAIMDARDDQRIKLPWTLIQFLSPELNSLSIA